ncbi:MAG: hypothetical protein WKF37_02385 [Bryobacteraceae bacterium]
MPRLQAYDGGHTAFHDHWIRVNRGDTAVSGSDGLRAWRSPPEALKSRNLGLASISVGSRLGDAAQLRKGFQLIGSKPGDGAVETARGFVLMRTGNYVAALAAFRLAADEQPYDSTRRLNLAGLVCGRPRRTSQTQRGGGDQA